MIEIAPGVALDEREIEEHFIRAQGPGGQNVNKVSSAVQLRFAIDASPALSPEVRVRLKALAGRRVTREVVLVIAAERFRARERNRADALARLVALIRRALVPAKPRRPTRPTAAARVRRRTDKAAQSRRKRERRTIGAETE